MILPHSKGIIFFIDRIIQYHIIYKLTEFSIFFINNSLSMHFSEGQHHYPPCKPAADLQKTMLSSLAAALIALLAAVGNIIMEFIRR